MPPPPVNAATGTLPPSATTRRCPNAMGADTYDFFGIGKITIVCDGMKTLFGIGRFPTSEPPL